MKLTIIFVFVFFLAVIATDTVPSYTVDLDAPASTRYNHIVQVYKPIMLEMYNEVKRLIPTAVHAFLEMIFDTVILVKYHEYAQEIDGVAKVLGIPANYVFIMNCIYELRALCTSIVTHDTEGKVILARNLDFGFAEILRKIHVEVIFTKGGHEVFRCGALAGFVGGMTCMKPGAFAVSLNARRMLNQVDMMRNLVSGKLLVTWMIRNAVYHAKDYNEVVKMLTEEHAVSGCYLTIAGIKHNEGIILTRDRTGVISSRQLNDGDDWYVAQYNNDPWNATDVRSMHANAAMKQMGRGKATLDRIADELLAVPPLFQYGYSVASVLMKPVDSYMKVIPLEDPKDVDPKEAIKIDEKDPMFMKEDYIWE